MRIYPCLDAPECVSGGVFCIGLGKKRWKERSFFSQSLGAPPAFYPQPHWNYTLPKRLVKHLKSGRIGACQGILNTPFEREPLLQKRLFGVKDGGGGV